MAASASAARLGTPLLHDRGGAATSSSSCRPQLSFAAEASSRRTSERKKNAAPAKPTSPLRDAEDLAFRLGLERLFYASGDGDGHLLDPQPSSRQPLRVAYQGGRGSYCQEAAAASFPGLRCGVTAFPCAQMEDAFAALERGDADRAVVPAENTIDGPVQRNFDLLLRHPLVEIAGELVLPVNHCLLALPGDSVLRRVASHPQALAHCRRRLDALALATEEVSSAAEAAAALAEGQLRPGTAVVASRAAAREFRLKVVEENLQAGGNHTRFLKLTLRRGGGGGGGDAASGRKKKATVAFALEKGPSELHRAIWAFTSRGLSVARVDHRPDRENPVRVVEGAAGPVGRFEYVFILDVEAETDPGRFEPALDAALNQLGEMCRFVRLIGAYSCTTA